MPVEIKECYSIKPFFAPKASVERLLAGISKEYLSGLATVVLRDSGSLNHDRRRAKTRRLGKKVRVQECAGLYHEAWRGEPAWIEIFVDNALPSNKESPVFKFLIKFSFIQDVTLSGTLYHEIGHHIHKTRSPEFGERERIADQWKKKLERSYFKHKYLYIIIPLLVILWPLLIFRKTFRHKKSA